MSKPAFSPPPYRVEENRNEEPCIYDRDGEFIALLPHQCITSLKEQAVVNSRLFIAAPDLLEACREAASALRSLLVVRHNCGCEPGGISGPEYVCGYHKTLFALEAAVAKAEQVTT